MTIKSAGDLRERVVFQRRAEIVSPGEGTDEYGNARGEWQTEFECRARLQPRLGSETVVSDRLQGIQPYIMTVRSSLNTRSVTPVWRAYDARAGFLPDTTTPKRVFDIKSIANVDEKRMFLDLLVTEGG